MTVQVREARANRIPKKTDIGNCGESAVLWVCEEREEARVPRKRYATVPRLLPCSEPTSLSKWDRIRSKCMKNIADRFKQGDGWRDLVVVGHVVWKLRSPTRFKEERVGTCKA